MTLLPLNTVAVSRGVITSAIGAPLCRPLIADMAVALTAEEHSENDVRLHIFIPWHKQCQTLGWQ